MTGYPDFQSYPQWLTEPVVNLQAANLPNGTNVLYAGASPAFAALQIRATPNNGYGRLQVQWFLDAALTVGAGTDTWQVNAQTGLLIIYPVQAPYCKIVFITTSAAALGGLILVTPTNVPVPGAVSRANNIGIHDTSTSVAASATHLTIPPFLGQGPATWWVAPADTSAKLSLSVVATDETGAVVYTILDAGTPTAGTSFALTVPLVPIAVRAVNTDAAAAHVYSQSLIGSGR